MRKHRFDLNKIHDEKVEDQKSVLPVEKDLNEQELATVTGGWGGWGHHWGHGWGWGGWGWGWGGWGRGCRHCDW